MEWLACQYACYTGSGHKRLQLLASHIFAGCFTEIIQRRRQVVLVRGGSKLQFMTASSLGSAITREHYPPKQPRICRLGSGPLVFRKPGYLFTTYNDFYHRITYQLLQFRMYC